MPSKLQALIDAQDFDALDAFLQNEPDVDLNHVTPNGLSALWVAVMPPRGKDISFPIIRLLLETGRVDPTQTNYGEKVIGRGFLPTEIRQCIAAYEDQYVQEGNEVGTLGQLAENTQNTHNSLVVYTYDTYVSQLYKHYVIEHQKSLEWLNEFDEYIKSQVRYQDSSHLQTALVRIKNDSEARFLRDYPTLALKNSELLMLLWMACTDPSAESFVPETDMSLSEQERRRHRLLDALIESQNAYGSNKPACFMGTRHKMVESLDKVHRLCVPHESDIPLLPEVIEEMYAMHCHEALCVLEKDNPTLWADYLGEIFGIDESAALEAWRESIRIAFLPKIRLAQTSRPMTLRLPEAVFNEQCELYGRSFIPISSRLHPQARAVEALASIQSFLNVPKNPDVLWMKTIIEGIQKKDLNWPKLFDGSIDVLDAESVLWSILDTVFQNVSLGLWLRSLSLELKSDFYKKLLKDSTSENTLFDSKKADNLALNIALTYGYWCNFPVKEALVFDDYDFRGFDLTTVDLSLFRFTRCDLRLTGVLLNPNLTQAHLESDNQIEPDAIMLAVHYNYLHALDLLTNRPGWEQYVEEGGGYIAYTSLAYAACHGFLEAVQMILNKTSSDAFSKAENGYTAISTALREGFEKISLLIFEKYSSLQLCEFRCHSSERTLFMKALDDKAFELADAMITKYPSVAADKTSDGETALMLSMGTNSVIRDKILALVSTELFYSVDEYIGSALIWAARRENADGIRSLLKRDASEKHLNLRDGRGKTALLHLAEHFAFRGNSLLDQAHISAYVDTLDAILEHNSSEAVINGRDDKGDTALMVAARQNNFTIVGAILKFNSSVDVLNARDRWKQTVLQIAVSMKHIETVRTILKYNASDEVINADAGDYQMPALFTAVKENCVDIVKSILERNSTKAVVNARSADFSRNQVTPLLVAAGAGYADIARVILEYDSSDEVVNARGLVFAHDHITALGLAAAYSHSHVVRTILEFNASAATFLATDSEGKNVLAHAVKAGSFFVCCAILDRNPPEEIFIVRNKSYDSTILMWACCKSLPRADVIKVLLEEGPLERMLNDRTEYGENALQLTARLMKDDFWSDYKPIHQHIATAMQSPRYLLACEIKKLHDYGAKLSKPACSAEQKLAGQAAIDLAEALRQGLCDYYAAPADERAMKKTEFQAMLQKGYHTMSQHIRPGIFHRLLMKIAQLFRKEFMAKVEETPIGKVTQGFFFTSRRQDLVCKIAKTSLNMG